MSKNKKGKITFGFCFADDDESVALQTGQHFGPDEMQYTVVILEHVDFVYAWNGLHSEFPDYLLQLLVICYCCFHHCFLFPPLSPFPSQSGRITKLLCQFLSCFLYLFLIHDSKISILYS